MHQPCHDNLLLRHTFFQILHVLGKGVDKIRIKLFHLLNVNVLNDTILLGTSTPETFQFKSWSYTFGRLESEMYAIGRSESNGGLVGQPKSQKYGTGRQALSSAMWGAGQRESQKHGTGRPESGQIGFGGPKLGKIGPMRPLSIRLNFGQPGSLSHGSNRPESIEGGRPESGDEGRPKSDNEGRPESSKNGVPMPFEDVYQDISPELKLLVSYQGCCALIAIHKHYISFFLPLVKSL